MKAVTWNSLSPAQRKESIIEFDSSGSMRDPRWAPLLEQMSKSTFEQLSMVQQECVKDLP